jgi:hypothetical protein
VTLAPQSSDLWAQFETLRSLAEACGFGAEFSRAMALRDQSSMDDLYRHSMTANSDAARALADVADWIGDWLNESLSASNSYRIAAQRIAEAAKQVKP